MPIFICRYDSNVSGTDSDEESGGSGGGGGDDEKKEKKETKKKEKKKKTITIVSIRGNTWFFLFQFGFGNNYLIYKQ